MSWKFSKIYLKKGYVLAFQGDSVPFWRVKTVI